MAYSYKGSISFGLVYIPVKLETCVKANDVSFNLLDKKTMSRVKYKKTCVDCGSREVKQEDIVKGYQYEDEKYVIFDDADFEKLKSAKDKNITIEQFADLSQIDTIYYDKPYYVVPTGGDKAFALLVKAMQDENKVGIAKTVLGTKEALVALRAVNGQMLLNTLHFHDEIQQSSAKKITGDLNEKELNLAKTLIESMSEDFVAEKYKDEYREKIIHAIDEKIAGKEITKPKERSGGNIIDIMDALQKSILSASKKKPTAKPVKNRTSAAASKLKKAK